MQKLERYEMLNNFNNFVLILIYLKKKQVKNTFFNSKNLFVLSPLQNSIYWNLEQRFFSKISKKLKFKLTPNNFIYGKNLLFSIKSKFFVFNYLLNIEKQLIFFKNSSQIKLPQKFNRRLLSHFFKRWRRRNLLKKRTLFIKKKFKQPIRQKKNTILNKKNLFESAPTLIKQFNKTKLQKKLNLFFFTEYRYKKIKTRRSVKRLLWLWNHANIIGYRLKRVRPYLRFVKAFYNIFSAKKLRKLLIFAKFKRKKKRGRKGYIKYIRRIKNKKKQKKKMFFFHRGEVFRYRKRKNFKKNKRNVFSTKKNVFIPRKIPSLYFQKIQKLLNNLKKIKNNKLKLKDISINVHQFYQNLQQKGPAYLTTNIEYYYVTFKKTKSNYYLTAINQKGEVLGSFSSGQVLFDSSQRRNVKTRRAFFNIPSVVKALSKKLLSKKIRKIRGFINPDFYQSWGTKKLVKQFRSNKVKIMNIIYESSPPHGLVKKEKKKRRL